VAAWAILKAVLKLLLMVSLASAQDWPRFRGPNGAGVAENANLPAELSADKNVVWRVALPAGHSSPIVSGGRIFLTAFEKDKLLTICLKQESGELIWRRESPRSRITTVDNRNSPASPSPAADGKNVFVFFQDFGLVSYTFAGEERWRTPLGPFQNVYGLGASPVLIDGKVILVVDQSGGSYAAAFDQTTGKQVWKTPREDALSGHSTPAVWNGLIFAPGSFRMDVYDASTGAIAWTVNGLASEMKSVPVIAGDTLYINGYNTPFNDPGRQVVIPDFADVLAKHDANKDARISLAEAPDERTKKYFPYIDLNQDGFMDAAEWKAYQQTMAAENGLLAIDLRTHKVKWKFHKSIPQLPSTLLYKDVLYMINDSGVLTTLKPQTGEVIKQARLRGAADNYYASPVAADGKVYFVSKSGVVTVLRAGGEQETIASGELDDECYATPAIAGGRVYIRTRSALYAFGKK
jgi:outer membrane protein assembly factor BamB